MHYLSSLSGFGEHASIYLLERLHINKKKTKNFPIICLASKCRINNQKQCNDFIMQPLTS